MFTSMGSCNGSGSCSAGTAAPCAGGFICANATSCKTACASDTDCQSGSYCANPGASGTCVARAANGGVCSGNNQCTSGICGVSGTGHCCIATCPATVAACAAVDCDATGACVYPGATVAPAALQTPGDCQKVLCNGAGGVTAVNDPTDLPTSNSACLINPHCSNGVPGFDNAPTGTPCRSAGDPSAQVCGDTSNATIAGTCVECNTDGDCFALNDAGTLVCNAPTGLCQ
jgi:hypothetical protein